MLINKFFFDQPPSPVQPQDFSKATDVMWTGHGKWNVTQWKPNNGKLF